jgi:mRNA interferase MazF
MTPAPYVPGPGDLIWTDFDPTKGREQAGRRPALVVSSAMFTHNTGLAVVCPIASRVRPFPTSVVLPTGLPITGEILTSHIRSIDTLARPIRYAGAAVPRQIAQLVRAKLDAFITIRRINLSKLVRGLWCVVVDPATKPL